MYFSLRLFALTKGLRPRIALAAFVGLAALAAGVARLALTGWLIGRVFQGEGLSSLALPLVVLGVLIAARGLLQYVRDAISYSTATHTKIEIRRRLYSHILDLGPAFIERRRTGDILMSLVDAVEALETFFGQYLPQFIVALTAPVLIFIYMAWLDVQIGLIFLGFALFTLFIPAMLRGWTDQNSRKRRQAFGAMGAEFLDSVQGLATLKAFGQSSRRAVLLAEKARALYRSTMGIVAIDGVSSGATILGTSAGATAALVWGGIRVSNGDLDISTLLIVLMLGGEVFRPVRELASLYHQGMVAMASAEGIFSLLDTPVDISGPKDRQASVQAIAPEIRFEGVSFGYEGGRRAALQELSFDLSAGETLGLVGPSGAGKSTIVWLLLRFYDPLQGRVLIGGQDIRDLPLDQLRQQISVVTQDTYLFNGTVLDNLRVGRRDATQDELEEAARSANAHEFISSLPEGYDTVVGERGVKLSGGERQRIAIARALLKSAPILILDEALSSVDAENEAAIQEALDRLMAGRTTLVIAHRLSSVVGADRIMVLDEGRLVETGSHQDLAAAGGVYTRLMANQQTEPGQDIIPDISNDSEALAPTMAASVPAPRTTSARATLGSNEAWSRLLGVAARWRTTLALTLVLGVAYHVAIIGLGAASATLVAAVFRGDDLTPHLVLLGVMAPLTAVFRWAENWSSHDFAYRILAEMRIDLYEKLEPLAPAYLVRRKSGDLTSVVGSDIETVENFFAHVITPAFVAVLIPVAVITVLAIVSWPLALVLAPFLVLAAAIPFVAQRQTEGLGWDMRAQLGDLNAYVVDGIQGIREVVAFDDGPARTVETERRGWSYADLRVRFLKTQALHAALIESITAIGGLSVLTAGVWLIANGDMDRAQLPLATLLALASFGPVTELAATLNQLMDTLAAVRRIFAVHDEPVLVHDGQGVKDGVDGRGLVQNPEIEFKGVGFSYDSADRKAIDGVSFSVGAGETVALVGRSGAGKTTSAQMLLRFWDPDDGSVSVGGNDLRDFDLEGLRLQIALVAQETYLFNTTIRENLRMARPEASDEEVEQAAETANAHEFVESFPDRYETMVGERGIQLSGGQRQRISIARALLKDSPILILDEATSHLDAVNEQQVREAMARLMEGRTTVVIAHRLSTVRDADRIVVLDSGTIREVGTHPQLVSAGGLYAQLVQAQLVSASPRPPGGSEG
jgi:ATP-binding cassette subfamily C protein CydCD